MVLERTQRHKRDGGFRKHLLQFIGRHFLHQSVWLRGSFRFGRLCLLLPRYRRVGCCRQRHSAGAQHDENHDPRPDDPCSMRRHSLSVSSVWMRARRCPGVRRSAESLRSAAATRGLPNRPTPFRTVHITGFDSASVGVHRGSFRASGRGGQTHRQSTGQAQRSLPMVFGTRLARQGEVMGSQ